MRMGINMSKIEKVKRPANTVVTVPKKAAVFDFDKAFGGKKLKDAKKEEFYSEVFLLLQSGLDLKGSIEIFTNQQTNEDLRNLFNGIEEKLIKGNSFSEALRQYPDFSAYEYYSIKIGEESGQLLEVLSELGDYYQRKMKQQKQLVSAFSYPTVILLTAIVAVGFMMNFIVPMFADAFKRFNTNLPALTLFIVKLSSGFRHYWWLIVILLAGAVLAVYSLQKIEGVRIWISEKIVHIPLFGILLQKIYLARFCQSMALMVTARTPLIVSLDLVGKMVGYLPLERALKEVSQEIYKGKMLNEAMVSKPLFDQRMVSLIKVGEETNKLEVIFKKLYEQYSEEADHRTTLMNSMLEPILIVVVGALVAVILIAMYLPMFKIGNAMV
jgi:type IV pilus assembly protein PilC